MDFHPFAKRFPLLQGDEWDVFKESIKETGGNEQPIEYRLVNGEQQGLDGRNRYTACLELDLPCKMVEVEVPDEEVKSWIIRRNIHRRHQDSETRKHLVAELRADGQSTRQIAEILGVPKSTVSLDLQTPSGVTSGVQNWTPENEKAAESENDPKGKAPTTVKGKDGKTYPATAPKPEKIRCRECRVNNRDNPKCKACKELNRPQRQPGDDSEADRQERRAKRSNGKVVFDDRKIEDAYGKLARLFNDRATALSQQKAPGWSRVRDQLNALVTAWKAWQKESK